MTSSVVARSDGTGGGGKGKKIIHTYTTFYYEKGVGGRYKGMKTFGVRKKKEEEAKGF